MVWRGVESVCVQILYIIALFVATLSIHHTNFVVSIDECVFFFFELEIKCLWLKVEEKKMKMIYLIL